MRFQNVKRGRLSDQEREQIAEMADSKKPVAIIARALNRHPATVGYAMYRLGLRRLSRRARTAYWRNGSKVVAFTPEEDAFVERLSLEGVKNKEIGERCGREFGHPRSPHTINVRLAMLASDQEAA